MKIRKEFKAGIIAIITLVLFWWLFMFLKGKNIFSNDNVYYVKYDNVEGLTKSKSVNINGLKVGVIDEIIPVHTADRNIKFVLSMKVDKDYQFSKNSTAQITTSMLNGAEINILPMKDTAPFAISGDTLKGLFVPGVLDAATSEIKPLTTNVNNVLIKLDSTLASVNLLLDEKNRKTISASLDELNKMIVEFHSLAGNANKLIASNSSKISSTLDHTNDLMLTANTTIEKYGQVADKINNTDIEKTLKSLETTINNLNQITANMNSTNGTMGKLMNDPKLYNNLTQASNNLSSLLEDLKANPKRYVHFSVFGGGNKDKKKDKNTKAVEVPETTDVIVE